MGDDGYVWKNGLPGPASTPTPAVSSNPYGYANYSDVINGTILGRNTNATNQMLDSQLQQQLSGTGTSVAQAELARALQKNQANTATQIASAKGINPVLAQRMAMELGTKQAQDAAGQGAVLRAQEMASARQQALQQKQLEDQFLAQILSAQQGQQGLQLQQTLGTDQLNVERERIQAAKDLKDKEMLNSLMGGLLGSGGSLMGGLASSGALGGSGGGGGAAGFEGMFSSGGAPMMMASEGGTVPGMPMVSGDAESNDTVPAMLSPGEVVIPRTLAKDGDAAKAFVDALNRKSKSKTGEGYGKVLEAQRMLHQRMQYLENLCYGGRV